MIYLFILKDLICVSMKCRIMFIVYGKYMLLFRFILSICEYKWMGDYVFFIGKFIFWFFCIVMYEGINFDILCYEIFNVLNYNKINDKYLFNIR